MLDSKSIGEERRSDELGNERAGNPVDQPEVSGGSTNKFLHTLPAKLKRLRSTQIEIGIAIADKHQPSELIELLGNALGIDDYATNMAAFWFLDTLALQVLKRKENLDEHYLIVLISWLAGEIMLIREKKLPRLEFFRLMKELFHQAANKISEQNRCPYWDEIELEKPEETEVDERKDDQEAIPEDFEQTSMKKTSLSTVDKKESFLNNGVDEPETFFSNVDPAIVLDTLMKSTYDMYANELRYDLIYAVFVQPIEVHAYQLPFSIRKPRPTKLSDPMTMPFNVGLRRTFEIHDVFKVQRVVKAKGKKNIAFEMPSTPANSFQEDEVLVEKRRFILPLIEANEALVMFDQFEGDV